jgi:hypothetical protein
MSAETLEALKADYEQLGARIAAYEANRPRVLNIAGVDVELHTGEHYAGAVLNEDGTVKHHLIRMAARPTERMTWADACAWAKSVGGDLPTRQEAALLFANCKPHLIADWHWTSEEHENASSAWSCLFSYGTQYYYHKSCEGLAVAVRRF